MTISLSTTSSSTGTLSSVGIGSGLDVKSIVSALVAIEKQPLTQLQTKATSYQTELSTYGTVKSQMATLQDAASTLALSSGWNAQTATSSNSAAVGVAVDSTASPTNLTVNVTQLAQAQSTASQGFATDANIGASGTLSIQMGAWSGNQFTAGSSSAVSVSINTTDNISSIARKINTANAGVTATVLSDGTNQRLVVRSTASGSAAGFSITTSADANDGGSLASFGFADPTRTSASATGMFMGQVGKDANLTVNGVALVSSTNSMKNVVPGVSLQLSQVTTSPVEVAVTTDSTVIQKNIQSFVDAYNAVNSTLSDATKYDSSTQIAGPLQGDSTAVGLLNSLRSMMSSNSTGSTYSTLSSIGLERQKDGSITINQTKLTSAMTNMSDLQKLFTVTNTDATTSGFGVKVRNFAIGMLGYDGQLNSKTTSLQGDITRNKSDQDAVNARATQVENNLNKQYSALDAQMATMSSLSSYVTAQLATWNKSTS
ncbi:flagellar filament capping protein FliD [Rhodoferax sp.]|uniref:flagellar filament capping protein FliD n=1 Tax=Rhodoferax sp. TaxID=50421 RepID=UPI00283FFE1C|nr:flagellar filament capping protein FliD [Rhodoferax sp.]MDR3371397.1 flagellar filament capping protein FliD [Rhodoferax sp.]